jgi:uncharacterized protein
LRVVEECLRLGVPVNLHTNEEVGHFYLGKSTIPLRDYYRLICRYPEAKWILAHWGGGLFFYEIMPEVWRTFKNVYYDTAGGPLLFPTRQVFAAALGILEARKILYGSDYPLMICPKKQEGPTFEPFLAEIDSLELEKAVYDDILGNNCARLLGFLPDDRVEGNPVERKKAGGRRVITELTDVEEAVPSPMMAVSLVAAAWPATRVVFEKYGIPWEDSPVPYWEPVVQAAAARGMGPAERDRLMAELIEARGDQA